jgi:hypothetical protein
MKLTVLTTACLISILMMITVIMVSADEDDDEIVGLTGAITAVDSNDFYLPYEADSIKINTCPKWYLDLNATLIELMDAGIIVDVSGEAIYEMIDTDGDGIPDTEVLVEIDAYKVSYMDSAGIEVIVFERAPGKPPWSGGKK